MNLPNIIRLHHRSQFQTFSHMNGSNAKNDRCTCASKNAVADAFFAVFCLVKAVNRLHRKKETAPPPPPQPSREEQLLTEIRDLLKERT